MVSSGSWSYSNNNHVSLLSTSQQTALPLPKSVKGNRSFANLAKLFGISTSYKDHHSDAEDDEEEEVGEAEEAEDAIDEDSLMWDAQTALIAHQPSIAMQHYTVAALPPHRSAGACLALGNLLTRGSGLIRRESTSNEPLSPVVQDKAETKSATTRFRDFVFRSPPTSPPPEPPVQTIKPVAVGWAIPTDGKRAVRDVEGMGVAGGWLVLGLGWLVEEEMAKSRVNSRKTSNHDTATSEDDGLSFAATARHYRRSTPSTRASSRRGSISAQEPSVIASNDSSDVTESTLLKTPYEDDRNTPRDTSPNGRTEHDQLKLFYELMSPLVSLYRHGQIQAHDPVSLPPISSSQLPACLQPQGDHQKRRNAWNLGGVVMEAIHDLDILRTGSLGKGKGKEIRKTEQLRIGVAVMVNYLLGLTGTELESESFFRQVVHLGQTGMEVVDELVRQAAARLDIILRSPPPTATPLSPHSEYPFPQFQPPSRSRFTHNRVPSTASRFSIMSTMSARLQPSGKSTASLASMFIDGHTVTRERPTPRTSDSVAVSSLRRIRASSAKPTEEIPQTWWPKLSTWSMMSSAASDTDSQAPESVLEEPESIYEEPSPLQSGSKALPRKGHEQFTSPETLPPPDINTIAPTPHTSNNSTLETPAKPRRRLPFEPSESDSICTIDPELAAAELRSALTKNVICGVCGAKGLNFPECPRCSLTFCSRSCRVDEKKAGNGKRHICGAWESRKLLSVPVPAPKSRRKSNAVRLGQSIKA